MRAAALVGILSIECGPLIEILSSLIEESPRGVFTVHTGTVLYMCVGRGLITHRNFPLCRPTRSFSAIAGGRDDASALLRCHAAIPDYHPDPADVPIK